MTPRPDPYGRRAILATRHPKTPEDRIALYHRAKAAEGQDAYLLPSRGSATDEIRPIHIRSVKVCSNYDGERFDDPELLRENGYSVVVLAHTLDNTRRRQYMRLNAHAVLLPGEDLPQ